MADLKVVMQKQVSKSMNDKLEFSGDGNIRFVLGSATNFKVKQTASGAGRSPSQIATLKGLGLNKIGKVAIIDATPANVGMLNRVRHLLSIVN